MVPKKESIWELLKRLDEQAAVFNEHIARANFYFDEAAAGTQKLVQKHQRDIHKTIEKLQSSLRKLKKKRKKN